MGVLDAKPTNLSIKAWSTNVPLEAAVPQLQVVPMQIAPTQAPSILANAGSPFEKLGDAALGAVAAFSPAAQKRKALEEAKLKLEGEKGALELKKMGLESQLLEKVLEPTARLQNAQATKAELGNELQMLINQREQMANGQWGADAALSQQEKLARINEVNSQIEQQQNAQKIMTGALANSKISYPQGESSKVLARLPGGKTVHQVSYDETEPMTMDVNGMKIPIGERTVRKTKVVETDEQRKLSDTDKAMLNDLLETTKDVRKTATTWETAGNDFVEVNKKVPTGGSWMIPGAVLAGRIQNKNVQKLYNLQNQLTQAAKTIPLGALNGAELEMLKASSPRLEYDKSVNESIIRAHQLAARRAQEMATFIGGRMERDGMNYSEANALWQKYTQEVPAFTPGALEKGIFEKNKGYVAPEEWWKMKTGSGQEDLSMLKETSETPKTDNIPVMTPAQVADPSVPSGTEFRTSSGKLMRKK